MDGNLIDGRDNHQDILVARIRQAVADPIALRQALEEADIVPTLLTLAHLSGEDAFLEKARPHINGGWNFMVDMPAPLTKNIRKRLIDVLSEIESGEREIAPPPLGDRLHLLMNIGVGLEMPAEYVPLMLEEMRFDDRDPRRVEWRASPPKALANFKTVIVGAGLAGILMAIKLKEAGYDFTIYDRADAVGGTWYVNRYPGCGVDTPNHFFSYSFEPNHDWPEYFSKRDDLWDYQERMVEKYDLRRHIQLETEVENAKFNADTSLWTIDIKRRDGATETIQANAFITAVGQLNTPSIPDFEGLDAFEGDVLHTAEWDPTISLKGKRVAMIGTGASGMQTGPTIAPDVGHLTIYQRSAHWAVHNANYHRTVADGKKWALKHLPFYAKWHRFLLFWAASDVLHDALHIDPNWPNSESSLNATNQGTRDDLIAYMRKELGGDETLLAKTTPPFPPYGKRMLRDNNWYKMLTRSNVDLITTPIQRMTKHGVETEDETVVEVDAIILATGFQTARMLGPLGEAIINPDGECLRDSWNGDDPRAHLGMTSIGFPNLFMLYGPGTNLAHGGSIIFHMECQARYIMQALREMLEGGHSQIECHRAPHDAYNAKMDAKHKEMVWSHSGVSNWYKNAAGRVFANSPWRLVDYWAFTATIDPEEYSFK